MKRKTESGIQRHLSDLGLWEQPPEILEAAKRKYWNRRKLELKKEKLKHDKGFTVYYSPAELRRIADCALLHEMSRSRYIKMAALAYADKKYLVPNNETLFEIKALLALTCSAVRELYDVELLPEQVGSDLQNKIESLETSVLHLLFNPKPAHIDR